MSESARRRVGPALNATMAPILVSLTVAVVAALTLSTSPLTASPLATESLANGSWRPGTCPALTDSIRRVYLVVLGREPDTSELASSIQRSWTGQVGLEQLATELLASSEYRDWYGELDDDAFIVEAHRTALGSPPSADDRRQWLRLLGADLPRAHLVLLLAESEPVVTETNTHEPMAGFLQWYPAGTHWYCGTGIANELPIAPLTDPVAYTDVLFSNRGSTQDVVALRTTLNGVPNIVIQQSSLPPGFTSFEWGGLFSGNGNYGTHLDIRAGDDTSWAVVFYPSPLPDRRAGWQISS